MAYSKWISKEVLFWENYSQFSTVLAKEESERAYKLWEHAKYLIENNETEFHLSDGIANLKRVLNQRLQHIEKIYNFKTLDFKGKPKGYLELLELLGVVRPFLMKQLLIIRNDIEHRDTSPPTLDRCLEFLDIIWYFLKSTDQLVQVMREGLLFEEDTMNEGKGWIEMEYKLQKHEFHFRGRISQRHVNDNPIDDSFEVVCEEDKENVIPAEENSYERVFNYIRGQMKIADSEKVVLIKKFLFSL